VQPFGRILLKVGALLASPSLTGGNGLVPLFVGLVAHTLARGHRPPDFSGPSEVTGTAGRDRAAHVPTVNRVQGRLAGC